MSHPDHPEDPPRPRGSVSLPPEPPTYEDGPAVDRPSPPAGDLRVPRPGAAAPAWSPPAGDPPPPSPPLWTALPPPPGAPPPASAAPPPAPTLPGGDPEHPQSRAFAWGAAPLPVAGGPAGGTAAPDAPAPGWIPPPAPPRHRGSGRRVAVPVLSGVATILLVAASAAGYLWWATSTELDETRAELTAEVEELTGTIEDNDAEIGRLNDDLQAVEDELGEAETQLEGTRNMVNQLEDEQGVIRRCITLSREAQEAVLNNDQAAFNAVIDEVTEACADADAILGF